MMPQIPGLEEVSASLKGISQTSLTKTTPGDIFFPQMPHWSQAAPPVRKMDGTCSHMKFCRIQRRSLTVHRL